MQKLLRLALALALTSCDDGAPAGRPAVTQDQLWSLAPAKAAAGIVASPYGIGMLEDGVVSLRSFMEKAGVEMDAAEEQLDALLAPMGGRTAKLANLGLTRTKGGALFLTRDEVAKKYGWVAVVPITDRTAFLALVHGKPSATPDGVDTIENLACKLFGQHYVCASDQELLGTVGKGTLKPQIAKVGARGDIELIGTNVFGGEKPATVVATIQLERGELVARGLVINPPARILPFLAAPVRPRTQIGRSAGLTVIDPRALFEGVPAVPLVDGVTFVDLVKTIAGPMTVTIPAGGDLDMEIPLSDPAPATKVLAKCDEVALLKKELATKLVNGVCTIHIDQVNLDLDVWVDGSTLHVGHKGKELAGKPVPLRPTALEVATGQWALVVWGRGSSLAARPDATQPDVSKIDPRQLTLLRLMLLVDEIGFAAKKETTPDGDALRFVIDLRTSFANPAAVVDALVAITALDVVANKAAAKAKPIAEAHPGSLFAADFTAGQYGLFFPTKLVDFAWGVVLPAIVQYARNDKSQPEPPTTNGQTPDVETPQPPAANGDGKRTKLIVEKYASDVYPAWAQANPGKPCPTMKELALFVSPDAVTDDEWGKPIVLLCGKDLPAGAKGVALISAGPDGKPGTPDDLKSY